MTDSQYTPLSPDFEAIADFPAYRINRPGVIQSCWRRAYRGAVLGCEWKTLRLTVTGYGYLLLDLRGEGHQRNAFAHTLVLETFVGPCPDGMMCRHLDGNRKNNRLDNLAWGTDAENKADMVRHGTRQRGSLHYLAKLTEDDVRRIRRLKDEGLSIARIADQYPVTRGSIEGILAFKRWAHVL